MGSPTAKMQRPEWQATPQAPLSNSRSRCSADTGIDPWRGCPSITWYLETAERSDKRRVVSPLMSKATPGQEEGLMPSSRPSEDRPGAVGDPCGYARQIRNRTD